MPGVRALPFVGKQTPGGLLSGRGDVAGLVSGPVPEEVVAKSDRVLF
jgi:hypothetical protein